jgi:hypothetical protein
MQKRIFRLICYSVVIYNNLKRGEQGTIFDEYGKSKKKRKISEHHIGLHLNIADGIY